MPTGYQYRKIKNFPELNEIGAEWQSSTQLALPMPGGDDSEHSMIRFLGISDHPDFYKYFVKHETVRSQKVRFANEERGQIIAIEEFHLYIPQNYSYLYADVNARVCNELLKRTKADIQEFDFISRNVNLIKMKEQFQMDVRGGWFSKLNIADVKAAAIFGSNVGDSEDWQRYEVSGEISSLILEFTYRGAKHSVQITKNGAIVLYENFSEDYALNLLEEINDIVRQFEEEVKS